MLRIGTALLFLNYFFWILVSCLLFSLFGKLKTALRVQAVIMLLLGLLNHYLFDFRGTPIQPWDIKSAKTALGVAKNYNYALPFPNIVMILIFFLIFLLCGCLKLTMNRNAKYNIVTRLVLLVSSASAIILFSLFIQAEKSIELTGLFPTLFVYNKMVEKNGTAITFIYSQQFMNVSSPSGYSKNRAVSLLYDAVNNQNHDEIERQNYYHPDIIVIMNESFSDLKVLGDFKTNTPVMPFTDSVLAGMDNTVSGHMTVPVLGGNTPNTEFEFLTGNSMDYLPQGCVPYQQFINSDTDSVASILKKSGYETIAIHPYKRKGWDREKVYELFGFDRYISEDDFINAKLIRNYISDVSDYDMIMDIYEKQSETPLFIFNVTMQNHGAYWNIYDNFTPEITVNEIDDREFGCYLSLINESDKAIHSLICRLSRIKRPVILVFFGDHQPADTTVDELYLLQGRDISNLSEIDMKKRYIVPFFIWTNYETPTEANLEITPYELGLRVMKMSGVKLSDYQLFIDSFCKGRYTDNDYATVQYYEMFERETIDAR